MHPAKEGFSALPFFDEFDLSTVDILLISQYVEFPYPSYISDAVESETTWELSCSLLVYDERLDTVNVMHLFLQFLVSSTVNSLDIIPNNLLHCVHYLHLLLLS